jgi:hypothetical protein
MPLKHPTETFLIVILSLAIVAMGVALATLPPLPGSAYLWLALFILSLVYPIIFYPLLKKRRADYLLRVLHFVPAMMAAVWLILQLLALAVPSFAPLPGLYVWQWTLPAVLAGFVLIWIFCLHVVRQRWIRTFLLLLVAVPFVAAGFMSTSMDYNKKIASILWDSPLAKRLHVTIAQQGSSAISNPSSSLSSRDRENAIRSSSHSSTPPHLTSAGPVLDGLVLLCTGLYGAAMHRKTKKRFEA